MSKQVEEARAEGAEVLSGGGELERDGIWFEPTVLLLKSDLSGLSLLRQETFGPVLPVVACDDTEEAVRLANDTRFGLTASVWGKRAVDAERVARRLVAGVVTVNNHGFTGAIPSLPWGGPGDTGSGVTGSVHALEAVTRPFAVVVDTRRADRELWWYPYGPAVAKLGRSFAILRGGGGPVARVGAAWSTLSGLATRWR